MVSSLLLMADMIGLPEPCGAFAHDGPCEKRPPKRTRSWKRLLRKPRGSAVCFFSPANSLRRAPPRNSRRSDHGDVESSQGGSGREAGKPRKPAAGGHRVGASFEQHPHGRGFAVLGRRVQRSFANEPKASGVRRFVAVHPPATQRVSSTACSNSPQQQPAAAAPAAGRGLAAAAGRCGKQ